MTEIEPEEGQTMRLTPDEKALVQRHREEAAAEDAKWAFRNKAAVAAARFVTWQKKTGEGLTFSTFVNAFFYQDEDGRQMYDAVKRILEAAWPQSQ